MSITPLRVRGRGESDRRNASFSEPALARLIAIFQEPNSGISRSRLAELHSLARERDPELLGEGLLSFAGRLEGEGKDGQAAAVYETILGQNPLLSSPSSLDPSIPPFEKGGLGGISRRAQERLTVLRGGGSFGARFEHHARHFTEQVSDPSMIAGMGAAGLVSSALRLSVLTRLASQPASWLSRGFGARLSAGAVSLAFEAPAFTAAVHGTNSLLGRSQDNSLGGLGRELASGYLLLGALRLSGGTTRNFAERMVGPGGASPAQRSGLALLEQGGTFGAILASHRAEQALGWRSPSSGEAMAFDALATLLQFRVGSRLAETALGPAYRGAMREMQARTGSIEHVIPRTRSGRGISNPFAPALEPAFAGPRLPTILQMSSRPPKTAQNPIAESGQVAEPLAPPPAASRVRTLPSAAEALTELRGLKPRAQAKMLRDLYLNRQLAPLALEAEFQALRSSLSVSDFAAARSRLQKLEEEFDAHFAAEIGKAPAERRWESLQRWQNELYPNDPTGLARVAKIARAMGLPDLFTFKAGSIDLKARVRRTQEAADYFHELSLVRDFLRAKGLNRVDPASDNGKLLSNLLLHGDGNCVTLSLLFAHFAARIGRPLEIGLLPRHTFLIAKNGAAIDSILDFGMVLSKPYLAKAEAPEQRPLSAEQLFSIHLLNLGGIGLNQEHLGAAQSAFTLARGLLPNNPRPYYQLGRVHQRRGELELALENYRQVHELQPGDKNRYNSLRRQAWERIVEGEYEHAETLLRQMNEIRSQDIEAIRTLKLVYERTGRIQLAKQLQDIIDILEFEVQD